MLIKSHEAKELGQLFSEADVDKNGKIDLNEFTVIMQDKSNNTFAGGEENSNALFAKIDTDGNG